MPCHWYGPYPAMNPNAMFVLRDARDQKACSLALFPECLKSELHEVRATIEAYSRKNKPTGGDGPELLASGILFGRTENTSVFKIRVRTAGDSLWRSYILDRWD
jgi:hypothetical protein